MFRNYYRTAMVSIAVIGMLFTSFNTAGQTAAAARKGVAETAKSSSKATTKAIVKESTEKATKESIEKAAKEAGERVFRETGDRAAKEATERTVREGMERQVKSGSESFVKDRLSREAVESGMKKATKGGTESSVERLGKETVQKEAAEKAGVKSTAPEQYKRAKYLDEHPELHSSMSAEDADLLQKYRSAKYKANNEIKNVPNTGIWAGTRGDSRWVPDGEAIPKKYNPNNKTWKQILDENGIDGIDYINGEPDLSKMAILKTDIDFDLDLSEKAKVGLLSPKKNREHLHWEVFEKMAKENGYSVDMIRVMKGDSAPVKKLMEQFGCSEQEVWNMCNNPNRVARVLHEASDCKTVFLVPREIHDNINHCGGVDMYRALNGL